MPDSDGPGFGVYVHWPFCVQKCPYCDFNSHVRLGGVDEARYLAAFTRELRHVRDLTGPRHVSSIFLGGGTPSLMAPATVAGILNAIDELWSVDQNAEITLEANPGSVEAARFAGYRAAGVNRVSLGAQSFRDGQLRKLGRVHDAAEAKAAIAIARRTFERFSFDLIYAREGQTLADWRAELQEALALAGGHLSLYQLTIEPETPFARWFAAGKIHIPDDDAARDLYALTQEMTERAGLPAYEVSNHARPGEESRHNLLYWRYGEYAGAGPGAHGRLIMSTSRDAPTPHSPTFPLRGNVGECGETILEAKIENALSRHATVTERQPEKWLALVEARGHGVIEQTPLTLAEQADEMLLMGLRLREGLDLGRLERMSGFAPSPESLSELAGLGLLSVDRAANRVRATPDGVLLLNEAVARLSASFAKAASAPNRPMDTGAAPL